MGVVGSCLRDPKFSRFSRTQTCDRLTYTTTAYRASMVSRGRNDSMVVWYPYRSHIHLYNTYLWSQRSMTACWQTLTECSPSARIPWHVQHPQSTQCEILIQCSRRTRPFGYRERSVDLHLTTAKYQSSLYTGNGQCLASHSTHLTSSLLDVATAKSDEKALKRI